MPQAFTDTWVNRFGAVYGEKALHEIAWFTAAPGLKVMQAVIDGVITRGSAVVDLGCGPGCDAVFLATAGAWVVAVDLSPEALSKARALAQWAGVKVGLVQASVLSTGLATGLADVVNDSFTFHNLKDDARKPYAAEVHRLLRPGGLFILSAFSDQMTAGSGPRRITREEIVDIFGGDRFVCRQLDIYRNLPTEARPMQDHWFGVFQTVDR